MTSSRLEEAIERDPVRRANPFDTATGYSGQEYHRDREAELARQDPPGGTPSAPAPQPRGADIPPENGRRPFVDPATGAVHGSGSGAGGGNPGEDFDSDPDGGSGYAQTGARGEARVTGEASESGKDPQDGAPGGGRP
ncbi:MAG TPA: hypothetical protein VM662_12270 [Sphingomonas sp.]|nr:hypothetical protein [Sphingomonas sp.]